MQDNRFAFDVEITLDDAIAAATYSHRRRQSWLIRWTGGYTAIGGLVVFGLLPPWDWNGLMVVGGALVAIVLLAGLLGHFTVSRSAKHFYSHARNSGVLGRKSYLAEPAGLAFEDDQGAYFFAWPRFSMFGSTVEHLFLFAGGRVVIVPKRAFRSAQESKFFEEFVTERMRATDRVSPPGTAIPPRWSDSAGNQAAHFTVTRADLLALIGPVSMMSVRAKAFFMSLPCAVALPSIVPRMGTYHWAVEGAAAAITLGIGAIAGLVYGKFIYWEQSRRYARTLTDQLGPVSVRLSEDELICVQPGEASRFTWRGIKDVAVEPGYCRLMVSAVTGFMVPQRAFPDPQSFQVFADRARAYRDAATAS